LDASKIMWSSDYPHTDSPWPRSKEYIHEHFTSAPGDIVAKVVGGNAAALYGIN
jgi:predicted TIM-barrel fold metal-dependent hydrolase